MHLQQTTAYTYRQAARQTLCPTEGVHPYLWCELGEGTLAPVKSVSAEWNILTGEGLTQFTAHGTGDTIIILADDEGAELVRYEYTKILERNRRAESWRDIEPYPNVLNLPKVMEIIVSIRKTQPSPCNSGWLRSSLLSGAITIKQMGDSLVMTDHTGSSTLAVGDTISPKWDLIMGRHHMIQYASAKIVRSITEQWINRRAKAHYNQVKIIVE